MRDLSQLPAESAYLVQSEAVSSSRVSHYCVYLTTITNTSHFQHFSSLLFEKALFLLELL